MSQPLNAPGNAVFFTVQNSTLTGNSIPGGTASNYHAIYSVAIRGADPQQPVSRITATPQLNFVAGISSLRPAPTIQDYTS